MSANAASLSRQPGFLQGMALLLPITLAVIGVSVFTATGAQMTDHFRSVPRGDYLVDLLQTMPGFWIVFFSPVAGWLADHFGRRRILIVSMFVYAVAGVAPSSCHATGVPTRVAAAGPPRGAPGAPRRR